MKRILLLQIFLFSFLAGHSQGIQRWFEDFESEANGATTQSGASVAGTPGGTWSVTTTPSGGAASFSKQNHVYNRFTINQTGTEGVWASSVVDITSTGQAALDISLVSYYGGSGDYVRAYYKLNGGSEVLFGEALGQAGAYNITSQASIVLTGTSVQIIVRGMENTAGNTGGLPNMMRFDDVEITQVSTLYSRNGGGNWGTSGTWSTVGLNGATCGCTPDNTTNVVIGNSDVVNVTAASTAINITVQNSSTLQWTAGVALTAARGGSVIVSNTASINRNGNAAAQIIFPVAAAVGITVNSSNANALAIGDIVISGASTVTISGTGSITTGRDLSITGSATIVNNLSGTFTVGRSVVFNASNISFTNNGTFTVTTDFGVNASTNSGCTFTNAASRTFNVGTISPSGSNFILNNAGTINQSGEFPNGEFTASTGQFNNQATGIWNYSVTPNSGVDPDIATVLNLSTVGNTFNYSAAGNQNFIVASYYNLGISGAGSKYLQANTDVNGNLTISGASSPALSSNTRNITLAGNWSILNAASFTQGTGTTTVTFDGTSDQTISVAAGSITFNNVIINKASGNVLLSSTSPTIGGTLTLTTGGLQLNGNALNVTNTATTAIARTNGFIISETTGTPYAPVVWTIGTATGSYTFPFGTASGAANYIPFVFNITSAGVGAAGKISVATYPTAANNTPFPSGVTKFLNSSGVDNSANVADRFWIITPTTYTTSPTATLTFNARSAEVGTITTLRAQRWNSGVTDWDLPIAGQTNPTTTSAQVSGVSTFSPWTLSGNNTPLPIKLAFFTAKLAGSEVQLTWQTAQEINNDYFTIEKSSDAESFEELIIQKGSGSTLEVSSYSAVDRIPYFGRSYYRLKQTDFDGQSTYSNVQVIDYEGAQFVAYPSPSQGNKITVEMKVEKEAKSVPIQILNMQGQTVFEKTFEVKVPGMLREEIVFQDSLQPGLYIIKSGSVLLHSQKIVVE